MGLNVQPLSCEPNTIPTDPPGPKEMIRTGWVVVWGLKCTRFVTRIGVCLIHILCLWHPNSENSNLRGFINMQIAFYFIVPLPLL